MNRDLKMNMIEQFPLLTVLRPEEKQQLVQMMDYRRIPRYNTIYKAGEASDRIFFLTKGTIKIGLHSEDGKEVIKTLIHPFTIFGEKGLVGEKYRTEFAQSLKEEVQFFSVKADDFRRLMFSNFDLCNQVMSLFGTRLMKVENKLEALICKDARTRIVEFIKSAIVERGQRVGYEMLLRHSLTHQDIANITHTSRQTVTLVLNELKKSNLIYFNRGRILVRDIAKLA
ncbi:MAG: Crp/Fnr family transcriptional regulator [Bacteroidota bacterium]